MNENTKERMACIFNEWAKRYAADPKTFDELLTEDGRPDEDFGAACAAYFNKLSVEMVDQGLLPPPRCVQFIKVDSLKACARCGEDHEDLIFYKMDRPSLDMTHWAPCPKLGDPILLKMEEVGDAS